MTHSPDHAERASIELKIEQWREVTALEDRNMRTHASVIRRWADETVDLLTALHDAAHLQQNGEP